ncbi:hypothetical protein V501_08279 [Pseudogymnoascus sp. VKM F-4519 (FW-2642)]|nr:hypothetical protein V501_08279 [Pseudogymnoascus sp. VKM F-4519 (FW-2642)]
MPLDYSKWDALELSDDSDIEVHPNVDKRSFIRAKQNQIHQERDHRKLQIATFKYERIINDGFLKRIEGLLKALESHKSEAESRNADEIIFQSLMESADPDNDQPPARPQGVHTDEKELPSYSKMIATLIDQVKATVAEKNVADSDKLPAYLEEVKQHKEKVDDLQRQLNEKLTELELTDSKKITSESIHTGFDSSSVNKSNPPPPPSTAKPSDAKPRAKKVEVLNPQALDKTPSRDSGADADVDEPIAAAPGDSSDDEEHHATEIGKKFARIKMGDYRACVNFIGEHPEVIAERETDGLLIMAFDAELAGKPSVAQQCVHQALLLQYCRTLGRDGVGLFFKRITTPGHQAQKVFTDDVKDTYLRIHKRAKEILKEREKEEEAGGVEQIQLHAVEPGTEIKIFVPPKELLESADEEERRSREIFEAFPPGLQRALESASLDEVNKVLGKMSVDEAEEVVGQLSEGGMLSLGEQIIDTTTAEGQAELKRLEEEEKESKEEREKLDKYAGDPE